MAKAAAKRKVECTYLYISSPYYILPLPSSSVLPPPPEVEILLMEQLTAIPPRTKRRKQQLKTLPSEDSSGNDFYSSSEEPSDDELSAGTPRYVKKRKTATDQVEGKKARRSEKLPSEKVDEYAEYEGSIGSQYVPLIILRGWEEG